MQFTQGASNKEHINDTNNKCQICTQIMLLYSNPNGPWAKKITIGYRLYDTFPANQIIISLWWKASRGREENDIVCENSSSNEKSSLSNTVTFH